MNKKQEKMDAKLRETDPGTVQAYVADQTPSRRQAAAAGKAAAESRRSVLRITAAMQAKADRDAKTNAGPEETKTEAQEAQSKEKASSKAQEKTSTKAVPAAEEQPVMTQAKATAAEKKAAAKAKTKAALETGTKSSGKEKTKAALETGTKSSGKEEAKATEKTDAKPQANQESSKAKKKARKPGFYPLTAAQKLHQFTLEFCPEKQVLNIGVSLTVMEELDFTVLRKAIYQAYDRWDAMRLRFCKEDDGEILQYFVPHEEREIEEFIFTHWKFEHAEDKMREWTATPFERFDSPMNRIVLIAMPDGYQGLYLNVDHMTMDAYAVNAFLKDVIGIYCALKFETPYPAPPAAYEEVLKKDLVYENNSAKRKKDKLFWTNYLKEPEPYFTDIKGPGLLTEQRQQQKKPNLQAAKITSEHIQASIKTFHLEKEPSDWVLHFCRERGIPLVCLLLTALRTYLSKMNEGQEDISVKSTVSRRGTLEEKNSGGSRVHVFPCRTKLSRGTSFAEALSHMREAQMQLFRHADFDPAELMRMRAKAYHNQPGQGYECMTVTYQPLTRKVAPEELEGIQYKCAWYSNGAAAQPLYLTVMHDSIDNGLDFCFEYQYDLITDQDLNDTYYFLCRIMFMGMEHPDWSLGQIMDAV